MLSKETELYLNYFLTLFGKTFHKKLSPEAETLNRPWNYLPIECFPLTYNLSGALILELTDTS